MCQRYIGGALLAAAAVLVGPATGQAQNITGTAPFTSGEDGGFQTPVNSDPVYRLPTGRAGDAGFYTAFEFVMLTQTRAIGHQTIATRGFYRFGRQCHGRPGTFVGPNTEAINTRNFSPFTYQPGYAIEAGYRFDDGTRIFANYLQLIDAHYSLGAGQTPTFQRSNADLSNTFITPRFTTSTSPSPVQPRRSRARTTSASTASGTARAQMDIKFTQRYQEAEHRGSRAGLPDRL